MTEPAASQVAILSKLLFHLTKVIYNLVRLLCKQCNSIPPQRKRDGKFTGIKFLQWGSLIEMRTLKDRLKSRLRDALTYKNVQIP